MTRIAPIVLGGLLALGAAAPALAEPVPNHAPVADAGGPYLLYLGEDLHLDGSGSTDPDLPLDTLAYAWDLDHDGQFDDLSGAAPIATWALLFAALHPQAGMSYAIALRVSDAAGAFDIAETTVTALQRTGPSVPEPASLALATLALGLAATRTRMRPRSRSNASRSAASAT